MATRADADIARPARASTPFRPEDQPKIVGMDPATLAKGLGWFSIGLGLAEIFAPKELARLIGTRNHSGLLRSYGLREIAAGAGILTQRDKGPWLWSRVAGDALDLASLGAALGSDRTDRTRAAIATAAVAGVTALDLLCAQQLSGGPSGMRAEASLIVNRPPDECYQYWRNFENLPRFMKYIRSVRTLGERRSHWVANTPGGTPVEWDAEVTEDAPAERISWRTLPGAGFDSSGDVQFEAAPGNRGTIVRVQMDYSFPGAHLAALFAKLLGKDPESLVHKDLRRFKQALETGEVITTEGQPAGRKSGTTWLDELAR